VNSCMAVTFLKLNKYPCGYNFSNSIFSLDVSKIRRGE